LTRLAEQEHPHVERTASPMDTKLLDILACPVCKGPLVYDKPQRQLICRADRLAYPILDDIPIMLEEEARQLQSDDPLLQR
jgi:uncharacterized protein YbaR (Trm112 family)